MARDVPALARIVMIVSQATSSIVTDLTMRIRRSVEADPILSDLIDLVVVAIPAEYAINVGVGAVAYNEQALDGVQEHLTARPNQPLGVIFILPADRNPATLQLEAIAAQVGERAPLGVRTELVRLGSDAAGGDVSEEASAILGFLTRVAIDDPKEPPLRTDFGTFAEANRPVDKPPYAHSASPLLSELSALTEPTESVVPLLPATVGPSARHEADSERFADAQTGGVDNDPRPRAEIVRSTVNRSASQAQKTRMAVLLLTHTKDGLNTTAVQQALFERGAAVIRLDADLLAAGEQRITVAFKRSSPQIILETSEDAHTLQGVTSVWFRRPYALNSPVHDKVQREVVEEEFRYTLRGVWELLAARYWMSKPNNIYRAQLKVSQLQHALSVGLQVPDSIVTNDPSRAQRFLERGPAVFKPIAASELIYDDEVRIAFTTLLTAKHHEALNLIAVQPVLLQRFVEKAYEIRATVVGQKVFGAKITADNFASMVDWRTPENNSVVRYEPYALPADLGERVLQLVHEMGLEYAAVDLAVSVQGEVYFFEVNPIGQWLWIEEATGLPISAAIAESLVVGEGVR